MKVNVKIKKEAMAASLAVHQAAAEWRREDRKAMMREAMAAMRENNDKADKQVCIESSRFLVAGVSGDPGGRKPPPKNTSEPQALEVIPKLNAKSASKSSGSKPTVSAPPSSAIPESGVTTAFYCGAGRRQIGVCTFWWWR